MANFIMQTNQSGNHKNELMDTKKFKGKEMCTVIWICGVLGKVLSFFNEFLCTQNILTQDK
jgi:hypothetical protein